MFPDTRLARCIMRALLVAGTATGALAAQADGWQTYTDPKGRFTFEYPQTLDAPGLGTNDGFGDRVAAVRFSGLTGLGGEAVLTRGPVVFDVQALGGLYDPIALEALTESMRRQIETARPAVTPATFCQLLGAADHLGTATALAPALLEAARTLDRMRNIDPRVIRCDVVGSVATFHKEATFESGAMKARQHIFGAVRFLSGAYSAFHIARATQTPPSTQEIGVLTRIVQTFRTR